MDYIKLAANEKTAQKLFSVSQYIFIKRAVDIILAMILLVLVLPILIVLLIIITIQLKENPFFIQERGLSLSKYRFRIYKLKTLKNNELTVNKNKENILVREDLTSYVIPIGVWLRKKGFDELPQLINVIKGEMSFIGPRPLPIDEMRYMGQKEPDLYGRRDRLNSKPGISGYWQLFGNRNEGFKNLVGLDEYYERNRSILFDSYLMFRTIPLIFFLRHSDAICK